MKSLADQVYQRLRMGIITGQIFAGARLVELEIAESMGTSQGPVREALQRLEREGLVQRQAHSATFVTDLPMDEVYELFSIRSVIESFAMQRTVKVITPEQCARLEELVSFMRSAGERDDMFMLTENDLHFHRLICLWSGSATLLRVWDPLYSQIQRFVMRAHKNYFTTVAEIAETHAPIVAALRQQDADQATRLIGEHIMHIWSLFGQNERDQNQA